MAGMGTLFFFCGKMGAGKSTWSQKVASENNAVRISEDDWLSAHYPNQIETFEDYLKLASTIRPFVKRHVQQILVTGTNVVMDFPANTVRQRAWFVTLCSELGAKHQMIFLDLTDEQCLAQIAKRRIEQPGRAHFDTEAVFRHVTEFFEFPGDDEKLNMVSRTGIDL